MSVTLVTYPSLYDNRALWTVSTNLSEDSAHVNLRVEAHLYKSGTLIAKKVMPKGYTTFDFKNILRDQIRFKNPLLTDISGNGIIQPQTVGTNLITGWTNSGFDTFTSSGANITSAIKAATAAPAYAYSNSITMTKGQLYAFVWEGTINNMTDGNTLEFEDTTGKTTIIKFTSSPVPFGRHFLLVMGVTGGTAVRWKCNINKAVNFTGTTIGLYLLNSCDWYVPYTMNFQEKWEDSSGITQNGTLLNGKENLYLFFKSDAGVFEEFILGSGASKFLIPPDIAGITADNVTITIDSTIVMASGYMGETRGFYDQISKNVPAGTRVSEYLFFVSPYSDYKIEIALLNYNNAFVYQSVEYSLSTVLYSPIVALHIDQGIVATYPIIGIKVVRVTAHTIISEEFFIVSNNIAYPQIINLIWHNSMGGFSAWQFYSQIVKGKRTERTYYKDENSKNRILSITPLDYISCASRLHLSTLQMQFISDLITSDLVYWQRTAGDLVEITILTTENMSEKNEEIMQGAIEFEY